MPPKNLTPGWQKTAKTCMKCKKEKKVARGSGFIAEGGGGTVVLLNKERVKKTFLDQRYDEDEILKWRDEKERRDGERPEHPQESFDKEVRLHRLAAEHGIAPKIYNVKPKKRSYELDRLDRTMLEYGLDKEKLEDSFQKKLISRSARFRSRVICFFSSPPPPSFFLCGVARMGGCGDDSKNACPTKKVQPCSNAVAISIP